MTDLAQDRSTPREFALGRETLLDHFRVAAYIAPMDPSASAHYVSTQVEDLFGYSRDEWLSDPQLWLSIVHPDDRNRVETAYRRLAEGGPSVTEYRAVRRDGRVIWIREESAPVWDEVTSTWHAYGVMIDVTRHKEAEAALRQIQGQFHAIFDHSEFGVTVADAQGKLLATNAAYQRMLGYTQQELLAMFYTDFTHPDDAAIQKRLNRELELGVRDSYQLEKRYIRRDGQLLWGRLVGSAVRNEQGTLDFTMGMVEDITDRKHAEEALRASETLFRTIFDNAPFGIVVSTFDGHMKTANRAYQRMLGYSEDELRSLRYDRFTHPDDAAIQARLNDGLWAGTRNGYQMEKRYIRKDGVEIWGRLTASAARGQTAEEDFAVSVVEDITSRKEAEREIMRAKEEAERANRAKSEFLSRMNHELRTPLHAILGFAQLLEQDVIGAEQQDNVRQILRAGRHLLGLINEVLDISRIEAGRLTLSIEPLWLVDVVRETVELVEPLAAAGKVTLQVDLERVCERWILADLQRLKQVLLNLFSNAIKYNRERGEVRFDCNLIGADRIRMSVIDTGIGIAPGDIDRIFVPFDRLGAEDLGVEGLGLGLSLCQHLMTAMGGRIGVDSVLGEGSTFWIELPVTEAPDGASAPARTHDRARPTPATRSPTSTILHIEDNASNRHLVQNILAKQPDLKLMSASQGKLGFELARAHRPAIILLDLNLPDIDGLELLHRLQADPATSDIPIVVASADASPRQRERMQQAGARGFLTKPFRIEDLLDLLGDLLHQRSQASSDAEP